MKPWKRTALIILSLLILSIPTYFVYTRFCLDKYEMKGETLTLNNSRYVRSNSFSPADGENLGKTIGIAVYGKRTLTDYIWPFWVMEYKNDKDHDRIFVRGLMDVGSVYMKTSN